MATFFCATELAVVVYVDGPGQNQATPVYIYFGNVCVVPPPVPPPAPTTGFFASPELLPITGNACPPDIATAKQWGCVEIPNQPWLGGGPIPWPQAVIDSGLGGYYNCVVSIADGYTATCVPARYENPPSTPFSLDLLTVTKTAVGATEHFGLPKSYDMADPPVASATFGAGYYVFVSAGANFHSIRCSC